MRILTPILLVVASAFGAQAQNPTNMRHSQDDTYEVKFNLKCDNPMIRPDHRHYIVPVDANYNDSRFPYTALYNGNEGITDPVQIPAGKYHLLSVFLGFNDAEGKFTGTYVVARENVSITADTEFTFDAAEAVNHIEFKILMPDGSPMSFYELDASGKLVKDGIWIANTWTYISYPPYGIVAQSSAQEMKSPWECMDVWSNDQNIFTFTSTNIAFDDNGGYLVTLHSDNSSTHTVSNDPSTYGEYQIEFAEPEYKGGGIYSFAKQTTVRHTRFSDDDRANPQWAFSGASDTPNKAMVSLNDNHNDGIIEYCQPSVIYLNDNQGREYGITAPFITDFEKMTMGVSQANILSVREFDMNRYAFVPKFNVWCDINQHFSYNLSESEYIMGNSCPVWIPHYIPFGAFSYSFRGIGGEIREIDLPGSDLSISVGGKEIIDSYKSLKNEWNFLPGFDPQGSEDIDIRVVNHNLMVDGITRINGEASLHIDRQSATDPAIPVIQMVQFRDADGHLADRLDSWQGAEMLLAAGAVKYNMAIEWSPLSDIKVEWAPYMSGNFRDMTVGADTDTGFMPTFGWLYRADMSQVMASDTEGWHDLRVTITTDNGSVMTQTISPAFCIGKENGIEQIVTGISDSNTVSTDGDYYDLSGRKCDRANLVPGLYIVTDGTTSHKVVVR